MCIILFASLNSKLSLMSTKNQLTTLTLLLFFGLYSLAQTPDLPSDVDGVSLSWYEQVQKDLSEREYVLHQNPWTN